MLCDYEYTYSLITGVAIIWLWKWWVRHISSAIIEEDYESFIRYSAYEPAVLDREAHDAGDYIMVLHAV